MSPNSCVPEIVNVTLFRNRAFANVIKLRESLPGWGRALNAMTGVPGKREVWTLQGEGRVRSDTEMEAMHLQVKELRGLLVATRS